MATIVVEVDDALMEAAVRRAESEHTTLDDEFRRWFADYVAADDRVARAMAVIDRIRAYVNTGNGPFTREAGREEQAEDAMAVIRRMQSYVNTGKGPFNREELNER